jgi:uncharacterized repeat protein (TIGR01451 family)
MKTCLRCLVLALIAAGFAVPVAASHGEISVSRSPGGPVIAGSVVSVTVNVANTSEFGEDLFDATVNTAFTDPNLVLIPGSVTTRYVELDNPSGTIVTGNDPGDREVLVRLAPVPPNWTAQVQFRMRVASLLAAGVEEVFTQAFLNYCHNNCQSIPWYIIVPVVAQPQLELNKTDFGAFLAPGGVVSYNLILTNIGNQEATGLTLTDTIPAGTHFYAPSSDSAWSCAPNALSGSVCTITLDNLWPDDPKPFAFALQLDSTTVPAGWNSLRNVGRASDDGTNSGGSPQVALDVEFTPLLAAPDLSVAITDGGVTASPDDTISYALTYAQGGDQDATGALLETTVPANTRFAPVASTPGWSCAPAGGGPGATCTFTLGDFSAGSSGSAAFALLLDAELPSGFGQITLGVSIRDDGTNGADPTPGNNQAVEATPVAAAPDLVLTKSDAGATARPGQDLAYSLTYRNVGDQAAQGVALQETVPTSTTFRPSVSSPGWSCAPSSGTAGATCTLTVGTLAAGASGSATFAVRVAPAIASGVDRIDNTATVRDDGTNGADPTPADNQASETSPVAAAPDLVLAKRDGDATARPGQALVYTLDYSNAGAQDAQGVHLEETVPLHTTFSPAGSAPGWTCTPVSGAAGATCSLALVDLAAAASGTKTFAVTVDATLPAAVDQLSNTAALADDAANGADPNPADNTATETTPLEASPDLTLTKDDAGATARPGEILVYTLSYSNVGAQAARGVFIQETVPPNTTFSAATSDAGWTCTPTAGAPGAVCTLPIGALAAGSTGAADFAVRVDESLSASVDQIVNTASVTDDGSNGAEPTPADNRASETTPLEASPNLRLTKSDADATARPGEVLTYTLDYANVGTQAATGVSLSETVPAYTTFASASSDPGWLCLPDNSPGASCAFLLGNLPVGDSGSVAFAVTVDTTMPPGIEQLVNTATVADDGSNGADTDFQDNESTETTPVTAAPDLVVTKDDDGATAVPGETVVYTITYTNAGSQQATNVVLVETLPAHTSFAATGSTPGWACSSGIADISALPAVSSTALGTRESPTLTCQLVVGDVAAGASDSVTLAARVDPLLPSGVDQLVNAVQILDDTTNGDDPNPEDNKATETTPVDAAPDLRLTKSDDGATTAPGELIPYTLSYTNAGVQEAAGVKLSETVPAYTTFSAEASSSGWSCTPTAGGAGATCTLSIGHLVAGASATSTFAVRVDSNLPAGVETILNTALIHDDASNGPDPSPGDNDAGESTPVDAVPDLALEKDDGGATARAGEPVAYTLTYRNRGSQQATGVEISETVPPYTTFSAAGSSPGWSCTPAGGGPGATCKLSVGTLGIGVSGSAAFAVLVDENLPPGVETVVNTAAAYDDGANGADPSPADNEATESTPVDAVPDLALEKDDGGATATGGQTVTYTLTYQNVGSQDAAGVELEETVPANTVYAASDSSPGWSCTPAAGGAGATCTLPLGPLAVGASGTSTFALTVAAELPSGLDQVLNTARIHDDGSAGADPTPANNEATDSTPLEPSDPGEDPPGLDLFLADMLAEDLDSSKTVTAGDVLTYTVELVNLADTPVTAPVVDIPIPDHTHYVADSARGAQGMSATASASGLRVTLPDLGPNERIGFAWDAAIDAELPEDLRQIRAQGTVTAQEASPQPSDDPDTPQPDDPTLTPLDTPGGPGEVVPIPTLNEIGLALLALLLAAVAWKLLPAVAP